MPERNTPKNWKRYLNRFSLILAAFFAIAGLICLILAPSQPFTDDSRQLQQELQQNGEMLDKAKAESEQTPETEEAENDFTAIGDSVLLGASQQILDLYPDSVIDASVSRQVLDAPDIIKSLKNDGRLYHTVIIALGVNGQFTQAVGQQVLDTIGSDHRIYWVIPYGANITYLDKINSVLQALAKANANLTLNDWPSVAVQHPEWFYDDGVHLNIDGQSGFAQFIQQSLQS